MYTLLVTSLAKLKKGASSSCYNESASTLEKLSIIKAWAEVYIVSMDAEHLGKDKEAEVSGDEDFGDFNSPDSGPPSEEREEITSLTGLVAAELPSLSKHWLAALKVKKDEKIMVIEVSFQDHALLSLPSEFKSQLPYEGGAFYTNDTIELARPHYK